MYKILDYVKYYKNISFNDVKLNVMDNLIGSILAYLPVESFREDKSLEEFVKYAQEFRDIDTSSAMVAYAYQVLDEISNGRRYKDIIISIYDSRNTRFFVSKDIFFNINKSFTVYLVYTSCLICI